jgi:quercetin dioxygenase-like cupin family protein
MAYKEKTINNTKTGQLIRFIQTANDTDGKLLEMESVFQPHSKEPVPHYHPAQQEEFVVLEGEITVRLNGVISILKKGDHLHIRAKEVHSMWNHSENKARVSWKVTPASDTEYFLEAAFGIANTTKNEKGKPGIVQLAALAKTFSHVFRMAKPAYPIQKIIFTAVSSLSYLPGGRAYFDEFID